METILQTWHACRELLPPRLSQNLVNARPDPKAFKKGPTDGMRLRVLPAKKNPLQFWNSIWCFYEVLVGVYGGGLTVGGLAFVQFPFQQTCGSGKYTQATIEILQSAHSLRSDDFDLLRAALPDGKSTILRRAYRAVEHPSFPVETAARDLAWLIQQTLPKFECL